MSPALRDLGRPTPTLRAALSPDPEGLAILNRNYEREKHLFFVQPPTMDEILRAIHVLLLKL